MSQQIVEETELAETLLADEEISSFDETIQPKKESKEAAPQEPQIPSKFRDKTLEEVVNSYTELEKEYGRKSSEVGELRKLTDDFLRRELDNTEASIAAPTKDTALSFDDLVDDPTGSIDRALASNPRLRELEEKLQRSTVEKSLSLFEQKHPDWKEVNDSPQFKEWINASKMRTNLYQQANNSYDYEIGDELFQLYKDTQGSKKEEATAKRDAELKNAVTETGSTGAVKKKVYRRSDLVKLRMTNRDRFDSMHDEIMSAYAEGRVR